jgi:hypothetical protein
MQCGIIRLVRYYGGTIVADHVADMPDRIIGICKRRLHIVRRNVRLSWIKVDDLNFVARQRPSHWRLVTNRPRWGRRAWRRDRLRYAPGQDQRCQQQ